MNRTAIAVAAAMVVVAAGAVAQESAPKPAAKAQNDPIAELVGRMRAAEQACKSLEVELRTLAVWPDGTTMHTHGTLRVLRGTQPALHTRFEFRNDDGVRGRSESAQTATGIVVFEDDGVFGEVCVQIDAKTAADLRWAGEVLDQGDLPGMRDRRAEAPLGSAMLESLRAHFDLQVDTAKDRSGVAGTWLSGKKKPGLDSEGGDVPTADTVTAFVRAADHALLEVVHKAGEQVVQQLVVERLTVDADLPPSAFVVQTNGLVPRPLVQHAPLADQVEQTLRQAEAKRARALAELQAKDASLKDQKPEVRPSRR
ncbi:MAG: hypothetical protein JNK15_25405 [Planctomycetes bacterium]|nr:hypothetical protein [Planctomycetota bacterium]